MSQDQAWCWNQNHLYPSSLLFCNVTDSIMCVCVAGLLSDWYPNLDALKESCRIASSYNWADVDLSPFQGAVWTLSLDLIASTKK